MYIFSSGMVQVHAIVFEGGYVCIRFTFCTNMLFRWFWKALACRELVEALFALYRGNNQSKIPCFSFHIVGKTIIKHNESIQLTKFMTWIVQVITSDDLTWHFLAAWNRIAAGSEPTSQVRLIHVFPAMMDLWQDGNFLYSVDTASEDSTKWSNGSIWLSWLRWIVT